jgi:hypothetical protein
LLEKSLKIINIKKKYRCKENRFFNAILYLLISVNFFENPKILERVFSIIYFKPIKIEIITEINRKLSQLIFGENKPFNK